MCKFATPGIKARGAGNEKREEKFLPPRSREWILLIEEGLKGAGEGESDAVPNNLCCHQKWEM
jgi:hypothetical protein